MADKQSTLTVEEKEYYMRKAIAQAELAASIDEVPIGAIVVLDGEVIGVGHNLREHRQQAAAHAEMFAIEAACERVGSWRLERAQLFVTLEPCPMCSGAMLLSRVEEVYYGAADPKGGTAGTLLNLLTDERFNHVAYVEGDVLGEECGEMLTAFFRKIREKKKLEKKAKKD